jgi:hypothetical protein
MTDEQTLRRLSKLESQLVELTKRVYLLENPGPAAATEHAADRLPVE